MHRLNLYLLKQFSYYFFSNFMPLLLIASMVIMIKLSSQTAVIQLTFGDMLEMYLFFLPQLLFYILPITFFISTVLTLAKLSSEYEMVVFFALGITPIKILKIFFLPSILFSLLLFFTKLVVMPHASQIQKNFIAYKQSEAQFNIKATEFGQKFGEWFVFIDGIQADNNYKNIVLYQQTAKDENFILAQEALIHNDEGLLTLKLEEGKAFVFGVEGLKQTDYEIMRINDFIYFQDRPYKDSLEYWKKYLHGFYQLEHPTLESKKRMKFLAFDALLALFPIMTLFLSVSFGIFNVRHQNNHIYLAMFLTATLYFALSLGLATAFYLIAIPLVVVVWGSVSYLYFRQKILRVY